MPTISMFYGIHIAIMYTDNERPNLPHIHARYARFKASMSIQDGALLAGELPSKQLKLVQAWIEIHRDELLANWDLNVTGEKLFEIAPLR